MASSTVPSSPSCLQLHLGYRCRESSSAFLRIRFRPSDRRIRLAFASGSEKSDRGRGPAWVKSNGSPDSFAGWSESESGDGDSEKKSSSLTGILGAGLAGVFFVAGVSFAALSLSSRSTSGAKQQMEPLTSEQEVLISSGSTFKCDQIGDECYDLPSNNDSKSIGNHLENEIGESFDLPLVKINEASAQSTSDSIQHEEPSIIQNTKPADDDINVIHETGSQEDEPITPEFSDIVVPDVSASILPENTGHGVVVSSDIPLRDSNSNMSSGTTTGSGDLITDNQKGDLTPDDMLNAEIPLNLLNGSENQHQVEKLTTNPITHESGFIVDDIVDSSGPVSEYQDIEQNDVQQLAPEASCSHPSLYDKTLVNNSDFVLHEGLALPDDTISSPLEGCELSGNGQIVTQNMPDSDLKENEDTITPNGSFCNAGIPAPSLLSTDLKVPPGKVLVPAVVDQAQTQALAALQVLKVIEPDAQPGDLCTRREYARWLVVASSALSRNTSSKVYPAMYVQHITELAFDDVTPEDPEFPYIQGLAEAGLISSKLSRSDYNVCVGGQQDYNLFSPDSPLSRQDLVTWKMALEKRQLPEVDRKVFYQSSGYIDIDKINPEAWPALVADLAAGEQSITALAFGYTRLFQPGKPVTKAQAAIALSIGDAADVVSEELARIEAETLAETAVDAHTALVAEVEKDLNASFEEELAKEREKIEVVEKLAEEARVALEKLRAEREEENNVLIRGRAAVESEMEVLSRLRHEVEEQLQSLMSNKVEISFEKERINKLLKEAENENKMIVQLQYELEVERKALSMARAWAEEEAKRAREQAKALEEARDRWERQGIKVVVDEDLQDDASAGITWVTPGKETPVDETINRAGSLIQKLKAMAAEMKIRSSAVINNLIQRIVSLISLLKQRAAEGSKHCKQLWTSTVSSATKSVDGFQENACVIGSTIADRAKRVVGDCREGMEKISQKFKT
ncbi:uncharacterized protein [Typha angustifolia]|uniref:uncharacterized protein isoform X2 n=1 Tax=Typha angustifolia TaxID=59011 RepID=UPI003C2F8ADC